MRKRATKHRNQVIANTSQTLRAAIPDFVIPFKKKKAKRNVRKLAGTTVTTKDKYILTRKSKRRDNRFDQYNIKGFW